MLGKIPSGWIIFTRAQGECVVGVFAHGRRQHHAMFHSLIPAVAQKRQLLREGSNQKVAALRSERRVNKNCPVDLGAKLNNSGVSPLVKLGDDNLCGRGLKWNPLVRAVEPSAYICKLFLLHTAEQHQRRD